MHPGRIAFVLFITTSAASAQPDPDPAPEAADPSVPEPDPDPVPEPEPDPDPGTTQPEVVPTTPPPTAAPGFSWHPFGYLRLQVGVVQNDPNVAFVGRDDGFALQNARVGVRGALDHRASFVISIDGAVDERSRVNDPDGTLRVGLRDAFIDFHVAGGVVDVRAGRFDAVFDPEHLYADTERPFVDRALESRGTRPTEGWETDGLPPGRSLGVAVRREPGAPAAGVGIGFELAVQNGADEFASDNDNDLPAISAAGLVRLANGSALIAAARWNPRTGGSLPFQQDETDLEGAIGARINAGPVEIGAGAIFVHTIFDTTGGPAQNAYGGHAQVMVGVARGAVPIAVGYRFAILDPSDLILTDRLMEHTAGAVIAWPAWHVRGQLNVTHVMEQADRELSNGRVEAALEVDL